EFLRAHAALVIIVVGAVVGGLEMVIALGVAADRERGIAHLVAAFAALVAGIQNVEAVAGQRFALEIDAVGEDADQLGNHRARHIVAQRGFVDALIEPHAGPVVGRSIVAGLGVLGIDVADVDRDIFAEIGERHR